MFKTNYREIPYEHGVAGCPEIAGQIDSRCGLSCAECTYKEATGCGGCIATNGHPFHGECELAKCAENKSKRFCGECPEFPDCELLNRFSYDPVHGENGGRIERCIMLKSVMIAAARKALPSPVGVCGNHCDHCFLGQWCGGCRSNYCSCSFATVTPEKVCPNVICVAEKGFDYCGECSAIADCKVGFFGAEPAVLAKASCLFMAKHGEEALNKVMAEKADELKADSVVEMLRLMETNLTGEI